ncbi:phosphonate metabolism protein/1,5-bisphosphokinase (PRPP-forming) PhnN [Aquitalea sp. ASV15]|uniref:phosphonate metabolism protein/1,5-bisphosphokinase (PRPP-forming) PhnN n=1 Tax=Aquitalea sp. ASV15 TaxID=2795104 RepID=UPI0018EDF469|nr:phosphonate metabolism protein/1,5-bisphosphokinase (PRPP-forming) PhnN [Aquitalea sp. ASV15]
MWVEPGRLWYVMGPSAAGKDSVLAYVRQQLPAAAGVVFAHRYITRAADAGGENHIALSGAEFHQRQASGCFALCWQRNGLDYALGVEVQSWLAHGLDVVVNGSRATLPQAQAVFPALQAVWITASAEVRAARLAARGRETPQQIAARLREADAYQPPPGCIVLQNDGALEQAGQRLLTLLLA